jgi:hypothetical protein
MSFSTAGRKKNARYALFSVVFICFAGLWAVSPFLGMLGGRTDVGAGGYTGGFIGSAKAVDLTSIGVADLKGASEGYAAEDEGGSDKKVPLESTSALSEVIKDESDKSTPAKSNSPAGGDKYTPSKQAAAAKKKGSKTDESVPQGAAGKMKASQGASGLFGGAGQGTSTTAPTKKDFFGTGNPAAKPDTKPLNGFKGKKPKNLQRLELTAGLVKKAEKIQNLEKKQAGTEEAFRGNLAAKDLETPLEEYKHNAKVEIIKLKNKVFGPGQTMQTFSQKMAQYAPIRMEDASLTEKEKSDFEKYMEKQEQEKKDANKQTLLMALLSIAGSIVVALIPK